MPAPRKVSLQQMETMVSFMEEHRALAKGQAVDTPQAKAAVKRLWEELAALLNGQGMGTTKTGTQWRNLDEVPPTPADVVSPPSPATEVEFTTFSTTVVSPLSVQRPPCSPAQPQPSTSTAPLVHESPSAAGVPDSPTPAKKRRRATGKSNVRFPCIALVTVTSVDYESLTACVDVLNVQHESVRLPETVVDVPLLELWPTMKQREECINAATTAEFIDLLRFFYNEIWMPWDEQDDKVLLSNTIEDRMKLWSDIHNGTIPTCLARTITLLRNSAINAHEKLRELDSSLCEGDLASDDDSLLPPNYISVCAEMNAKLDCLMARWTLYENPLIREQYLIKARNEYQKNKGRKHVVALWQGGSIFEFEEISKFLRSLVTNEQVLTVTVSAEDGLTLEPEMVVVCNKVYEVPETPLQEISFCSYNGATLKASDMRSCLLMLSENCRLRDLTLHCAMVNTVVLMRAGTLHIVACKISDDSECAQGDFAQGIVAMSGAKILIEDTTFDNFYSGIVVHKGAQVELRNCKISNCGVGIQMYSGSQVELNNTTISNCLEQSIRCELDTGTEKQTEMEGLHIMSNCSIGSGNIEKEVLIVRQDVNIA